ncbi:cache domain-containing protein [Desulfoprunum benzoelyticum]|uniref:PAS domain S-box-containing protein/putative nucleotidyltransferase with HDIG domain n=1 Tax=Desulfoprunum benzoelyticum TaxID=1506996 RepID=A0A840V1W6_9BACT|nr:cache domain-containing protein [Desulfoprunum benzoelyticum]MBB5347161.1 PAS domain S-box-containing protein/putative nucleotidyltransferase with HDIG domain [Desulfoprunum benzoelyticum]MBM9531371.1 cache domain-containing protein [Desulfoprunum benzoelyticum]
MPEKQLQRISSTISFRIALPTFLTILLFVITIFSIALPQLEQSLLNRKQEMIMELTETAWSLLEDYHARELRGELSPDEAKRRAILRIGKLRYGPGKKDYFWINDMTPVMIMHPYRPDIEGKDVATFEDPNLKNILTKIVEVVRQQEAGFVDYEWQWKDETQRIAPKISYVKGYEPWGWVIGTGMYSDDVKAEIAAIRNHLAAVSAGILVIISLLALYSIRQSVLADRERQRIFAERGRLMKSLEMSTERFRNLIETTSDWIWEIDRDGRCTYSSPRVENLLGFEPEEILHAPLTAFAAPGQAAAINAAFTKLLAAGKPFNGFEITSLGKDGRVVVLECNAVPIFDERGQLAGYRGVARDITERKTAMEILRKSRDDLHASLEETVASLASAAEKRDPYTAGHQQRVERLACAIAREIGYPEDKIEGLHIAALLHDIGKITLPSEYLAKPTRLSTEEKALFKLHPEVGYDILKRIHFPWPVAEMVLQHHEHLDGTGYPRGLKDDEILLEANILAVADVVEAMSSHRPYRPSLGIDIALDEIRAGRGIRYHAASVDACIDLILEKGFDLSYTRDEDGGGVG